MKNFRIILPLVIISALLLAACGTQADPTEAEPVEQEPAAATAVEDDQSEEPTVEEEQAEDTAEDQQEEEEAEPAASSIDGSEIYAANCAGCHASDRSGNNGPPLLPSRLNLDKSAYVGIITNGQGGMPSFSGRLSAEEISAVVDFILTEPQ